MPFHRIRRAPQSRPRVRGKILRDGLTMADSMNQQETQRKVVFVTVGTTRFDALIAAMDTPTVCQTLVDRGFTHLTMQASVNIPSVCEGVNYGQGDEFQNRLINQ